MEELVIAQGSLNILTGKSEWLKNWKENKWGGINKNKKVKAEFSTIWYQKDRNKNQPKWSQFFSQQNINK